MKTKSLYILLLICLMLCNSCGRPRYEKYRSEFIGFFDTMTVIVGYAQSEEEFNRYAEIIYSRMEETHRLFDIYKEYDGINNIFTINQNAGIAPVEVERAIIDMLLFAREGYGLTSGTVNAAMGSVLQIWHDFRDNGIGNDGTAELPPMDMLAEAAKITSIENVIIDERNNTVFLSEQGMSLDVGAFAKGYAAGLAANAARDAGARSLLLSVGGNITSIGMPMDNVRARWSIGIQNPDMSVNGSQSAIDTVYLNDASVSCSGDYQRFYIVDGQRYSHIIDPLTLMPVSYYKQVTVIHADAGVADLLSTALFILPMDEGAAMAQKNGAEALWIYHDGSQRATEGYMRISKNLESPIDFTLFF